MSQSIAVVCEAQGDFDMCRTLVLRVIETHRPDWYVDYPVDEIVRFRGFRDTDGFIPWPWINTLARQEKLHSRRVLRGEFTGELPSDVSALEVRRALSLLQVNLPTPDAVVFLKDSDNKADRREALAKLHEELSGHRVPVVIGVPHTERECWLLAGFVPGSTKEVETLERLCRELSLDPCKESHRLAAPNETDDRHPKRVLRELSQGSAVREAACLQTQFTVLETNGADNGLAAFLTHLRTRFIHNLFGGPPPEALSN